MRALRLTYAEEWQDPVYKRVDFLAFPVQSEYPLVCDVCGHQAEQRAHPTHRHLQHHIYQVILHRQGHFYYHVGVQLPARSRGGRGHLRFVPSGFSVCDRYCLTHLPAGARSRWTETAEEQRAGDGGGLADPDPTGCLVYAHALSADRPILR